MIQNLRARWMSYNQIPGYQLLESQDFIALKSPFTVPWHNLVFLNNEFKEKHLKDILRFFNHNTFRLFIASNYIKNPSDLLDYDLKHTADIFEMKRYTGNSKSVSIDNIEDKISIKKIDNIDDVPLWLETVEDGFGIPQSLRFDIATPIFQSSNASHSLYLACYDGIPAGGSFAFNDLKNKTTGLYSVATKDEYKGKGIARALVNFSLDASKKHGMQQMVLSCCQETLSFYEPLGFQSGTHFFQFVISNKTEQ